MPIATKRIYQAVSKQDGTRILVDRIWPRGIKKADAQIDLWPKDLTPSTELRKWFHEDTSGTGPSFSSVIGKSCSSIWTRWRKSGNWRRRDQLPC